MSRKWKTVDINNIWNSPVSDYLSRLVAENWSSIGITSEIEARLGRISEHGFDSGVSLRYFYSMRDYLQSRTYWTDKEGNPIKPEVEDEYAVVFEQNYRVIYTKKNNQYNLLEAIRKTNVEKETFFFDERYYSLRISLSNESKLSQKEMDIYCNAALSYLNGKPVNTENRVVFVRHRERISFNYNNEFTIDMTSIQSSESLSTLSKEPTKYEIECEMGLPKHHFCESVFLFLNGILRRLFSLDKISIPPETSIFYPSYSKQIALREHAPVTLNSSMVIELLNAEGYSDELIEWCKQQDENHRPILQYEEACQLQWSLAHPSCMNTLFGKEYDTQASTNDRYKVVNNGGTIRTRNGKVLHCCVWQYEGIIRNQIASLKRDAAQ